jgi:hypothetical protein
VLLRVPVLPLRDAAQSLHAVAVLAPGGESGAADIALVARLAKTVAAAGPEDANIAQIGTVAWAAAVRASPPCAAARVLWFRQLLPRLCTWNPCSGRASVVCETVVAGRQVLRPEEPELIRWLDRAIAER